MNNDKAPIGFVIWFPLIAALFGLGLWMLGIPLDWSSWKTYAGLAILALAAGMA